MSNIESELKLRLVDSGKLSALLEFLKKLAPNQPQEETLQTTYYDTLDYRLLKSGLSYRLRAGQAGVTATVKADGQNDGGLHRRLEFNVSVLEASPDIEPFLATPIGERLKAALAAAELIPICGTAFSRHIFDLTTPDGSEIELAVDCGEITAGEKTEAVLEIELELKNGSHLSLISLGAQISRKFPLLIELDSKLARALALAAIADNYPKDAQNATPITDGLKKEAAFPWIIALLVHLVHRVINKHRAFLLNPDRPATLHRLRISLRRLRTILIFAKPLLDCKEFEKYQKSLKEFSTKLGELRDSDVLEENWHSLLDSSSPIRGQIAVQSRPLTAILAKKRKKDAARLHKVLSKGRATPLFLGMWLWLEKQTQDDGGKTDACLGAFAKARCREWLETFIKTSGGIVIADADSQSIHQTRIFCRKTRYALACFAPVLNKHTPALTEALENLQDNLGLIRDAELSFLKLAGLIKPAASQEAYYDSGLFEGSQLANLRHAKKDFAKVWRKTKKVSRKWLLK